MIDQLKTTPIKISLYDLISTYEIHREILYVLFKKEIIPTNMSTSKFLEKIKSIKECDAISFYRSEKLSKEILTKYLALYIILMIKGWKIKITLVENGSTINVCSHKFLIQLQEKDAYDMLKKFKIDNFKPIATPKSHG